MIKIKQSLITKEEQGPSIFLVNLTFFVTLLLCGLKYVYGLEAIMDIEFYDESAYLARGYNLLVHGFPESENSPFYALWYFLLSLIQKDPIALYYLNYKILAIALPLALYWCLRRLKVALLMALVTSFLFLVSYANLPMWPKVYHFTTLFVLVSFACATYIKKKSHFFALLTFASLLSSFIRPELLIAFFIFGFVYLVSFFIQKSKKTMLDYSVLMSVSVVCFFLFFVWGFPLGGGERSFVAFSQHFSRNWIRWNNSDLSNWASAVEIVSQNFGSSIDSIGSAFLAKPSLFLKHMASNFLYSPIYLGGIFFVHASLLLPTSYYFQLIEAGLLALFIGSLLFYKRKGLFIRIKHNFKINKKYLSAIFIFSLPLFVSLIVIFPRAHYLLFLGTLLILAVFALLFHNKETSVGLKTTFLIALIFIVMTPAAESVFARKLDRVSKLENVQTIRFIQSAKISRELKLLDAHGGYSIYLGENVKSVPFYKKEDEFKNYLVKNKIDLIVVDKFFEITSQSVNNKQCFDFLSNNKNFGFKKIKVPNTDNQIFVRSDLANNYFP